jgi:hypothetical protein
MGFFDLILECSLGRGRLAREALKTPQCGGFEFKVDINCKIFEYASQC